MQIKLKILTVLIALHPLVSVATLNFDSPEDWPYLMCTSCQIRNQSGMYGNGCYDVQDYLGKIYQTVCSEFASYDSAMISCGRSRNADPRCRF